MPRRMALALVLLAALPGAPSAAFAVGNELAAPSVAPEVGSTSTAFAFSVSYEGGYEATSVTAEAGGLILPMNLSAGTALVGTWAITAQLPAGSWPVTFTVFVEQGNAPTVAGPTVTVTDPSAPAPAPGTTPPPTATPTETPHVPPGQAKGPDQSEGSSAPAPDPGGPSSGQPAPVAPPAALPTPSLPLPPPSASLSLPPPTAPAPPIGAGTGGASVPPPPGDARSAAAAVAVDPNVDWPDATPAAAHREEVADGAPLGDGLLQTVLLVGLAGVAAVALIGSAVLVAGRRREANDDQRPLAGLADATAILERRTLRRARMQLDEDPIVAAMGIGTEPPKRRPRRPASQVSSGPGERETGTRRR